MISRVVLFLLAAFALLALLAPIPFASEDRLFHTVEDAAHVPVFALLGWISWRFRPRLGWGMAALAILSVMIEIAQGVTGRDPGLWDAVLSSLGGSAGLLLARAQSRGRGRVCATVWALLCLLIAIFPVVGVWADRRHAREVFPVLADFSSPLERGRWTVRGVRIRRVSGGGLEGRAALRIRVTSGEVEYPGAFMHDTLGNWSECEKFCANVFLEGRDPVTLWIRADDRLAQPNYRDRAQQAIALEPGWNLLSWELDSFLITPDGRALDRVHPVRLGFFFDKPAAHQSILLDHLRLESCANHDD